MITRDQAESIVTAAFSGAFADATFMIAAVWEDADYFAITYGVREWLIDADPMFVIDGAWPVFIDKASGAEADPPGVITILDAQHRLEQMDLLADYTA